MIRPKNRTPKPILPGEKPFYTQLPEERFASSHPGLVELYFPQESRLNIYGYPNGLWSVVGGISWPMFIEGEGLVGIAHVAGFHL